MSSLTEEYDRRAEEIRHFIRILEEANRICELSRSPAMATLCPISTRIGVHILTSNLVMMTYNIMEASASAIIQHICDVINDKQTPFNDLHPNIQKEYLKHHIVKKETSVVKFTEVINHVRCNHHIRLENLHQIGGGNVDLNKLTAIANIYRCFGRLPKMTKSERENLDNIYLKFKYSRNQLAHGNISFEEFGSKHTPGEVIKDALEIVKYTRYIVANADACIASRNYLNP